jgi:hypothetical protein
MWLPGQGQRLVRKLFNMITKERIPIRKKPCREWIVPFLFNRAKNQFDRYSEPRSQLKIKSLAIRQRG